MTNATRTLRSPRGPIDSGGPRRPGRRRRRPRPGRTSPGRGSRTAAPSSHPARASLLVVVRTHPTMHRWTRALWSPRPRSPDPWCCTRSGPCTSHRPGRHRGGRTGLRRPARRGPRTGRRMVPRRGGGAGEPAGAVGPRVHGARDDGAWTGGHPGPHAPGRAGQGRQRAPARASAAGPGRRAGATGWARCSSSRPPSSWSTAGPRRCGTPSTRSWRTSPPCGSRTPPGQQHRAWALDDARLLEDVAAGLAAGTALIADGHHRYAAYLRLQDRGRPRAVGRGLAMLVDQDDTPLFLGAIHRMLRGMTLSELLGCRRRRRLPGPARHQDAGRGGARAAHPRLHRPRCGGVGRVPPDPARRRAAAPRAPPCAAASPREGDRRGPPAHRRTCPLRGGRRRGVAVLLPALDLDEVMNVLRRGDLLPEKATSFQPKPSVGVLMRPVPAVPGARPDLDLHPGAGPDRRAEEPASHRSLDLHDVPGPPGRHAASHPPAPRGASSASTLPEDRPPHRTRCDRLGRPRPEGPHDIPAGQLHAARGPGSPAHEPYLVDRQLLHVVVTSFLVLWASHHLRHPCSWPIGDVVSGRTPAWGRPPVRRHPVDATGPGNDTAPITRGHPVGDPAGKYVRRRPTLPQPLGCSTIGAERLNFRVRDGTGCFPFAMAAVTLAVPLQQGVVTAGMCVYQAIVHLCDVVVCVCGFVDASSSL